MKVLIINCGSSSIKYQLFDMTNEHVIAKGIAEKIGLEMGCITLKITNDEKKFYEELPLKNHDIALNEVMSLLSREGVIKDKTEIKIIGHRLVHAGEFYSSAVVVTEDVLEKMTICNDLAPLHNPHNITGVRTCEKLFPGTFQAGVFDTAFHQTMPDYSYMYPIDYKYYEKYKVRRYGFHGTSHYFVSRKAAEFIGKDINQLNIITCHLGNGCSIAAIKHGKSMDTSMGLTPVEGLMMGTRSGDLDPALVFFITEKENGDLNAFNKLINKNSGLFGVSGISNDMRDIRKAMAEGNPKAKLAFDMFCYRIKKYIGAYAAAMGGVDIVVFTGGIGENVAHVRKNSTEGLGFMGITLDIEQNEKIMSELACISEENSRVKVLVVPTDEELVIARESYELYKKAHK